MPVLLVEVVAALNIKPSGVYMDATFGRGGHAEAILARLVARRPAAVPRPRSRRRSRGPRARFGADPRGRAVPRAVLAARRLRRPGASRASSSTASCSTSASPRRSSTTPARGFSFMQDGPLDMRMSAGAGPSAADVVNGAPRGASSCASSATSARSGFAPRIARAIVADRAPRPFERTLQLAEMIARVGPQPRADTSIRRRAYSRRCASTSTANSTSSRPALDSALRAAAPVRAAWP